MCRLSPIFVTLFTRDSDKSTGTGKTKLSLLRAVQDESPDVARVLYLKNISHFSLSLPARYRCNTTLDICDGWVPTMMRLLS
jgi:hypothetical protein